MSRYFPLICLTLLVGCSESNNETTAQGLIAQVEPSIDSENAPSNKFGFVEATDAGPDLFGSNAPSARYSAVSVSSGATGTTEPSIEVTNSAPQHQIAYSYGFGFRISKGKIVELQQAHSTMCEAMGTKCRILRISQSSTDWDGFGEIKLEVAATEAGEFEKALTESTEQLGGELVSSVRNGENLSENIIDTESRLQSRLVLREKLTAILRNNRGSVAELIKAEQGVADVNEEIDATRSKLERYRNRIRYSNVRIEYEPQFGQTQLGFTRPVMTALRSIGTTLGTTIAALIYAITVLIPITLLILALRWTLHRFGLRIRFWRKNPKNAA